MSKGVSGLQLRNVPYLLVDSSFDDEKIIANSKDFHLLEYGFYIHSKTENRPEIGELLNIWKNILRNVSQDGPFMVKEELTKLERYKVDGKLIIDLPLKSHSFEKLIGNSVVNYFNHTYNIDNIEWPLWKVC